MLSGLQSLMVAYFAVWVIFFGYQFSVGRRLRHLQDEVERLKAPVDGSDVTLISYAKTVNACLKAADQLSELDISAQVIDLRTLKPLDEAAIIAAARKTASDPS